MVRKKLPVPPSFLENYFDLKAKGFKDIEIADEYFVCMNVLRRWKQESNIPVHYGRPRKFYEK